MTRKWLWTCLFGDVEYTKNSVLNFFSSEGHVAIKVHSKLQFQIPLSNLKCNIAWSLINSSQTVFNICHSGLKQSQQKLDTLLEYKVLQKMDECDK